MVTQDIGLRQEGFFKLNREAQRHEKMIAVSKMQTVGFTLGDKSENKSLEVIEGGFAQLEAKIVEDIFLNRYDPFKAALLKRCGRLVAVPMSEIDGQKAKV
jgi:hypothetical protein